LLVRRSVLIVDDHAVFRAAARAMLEADGFVVVGEAADGFSALSAALKLRPEVLLLDIQLPDLNGFEVARRLADDGLRSSVVFISSRGVSAFRWQLSANPDWRFIGKAELSGESLSAALG
jgi:DNA-binding NarL/FixJ family response regulator